VLAGVSKKKGWLLYSEISIFMFLLLAITKKAWDCAALLWCINFSKGKVISHRDRERENQVVKELSSSGLSANGLFSRQITPLFTNKT
jgi:hypothetical protein